MSKMSITRALAEIKRLDDRLARLSTNSEFVSVTVGKGDKQKVFSSGEVDKTRRKIQSDMDTINAALVSRAKIKCAIVQSNALTNVTVNGISYTIAEAIELKKSIDLKRTLVIMMKQQLTAAKLKVENANKRMDEQIEANLATIYGNDKAKVEAGMFEAVAKPQREQKEAALLDPLNLGELIEKIEEEISVIDTELDYILSSSNAKTEIDVD